MIQPIMVTSQEPDGRIVQQTQYQIIKQSDENDSQNQILQVSCTLLAFVNSSWVISVVTQVLQSN